MYSKLFYLIYLSKIIVISLFQIANAFIFNYLIVTLSLLTLLKRIPKKSYIIFISSFILLLNQNYQAFISCILILGIVNVYSDYIQILNKKNALFYFLFALSLLIILNFEYFFNFDFESGYGRGQKLFGIFHPKEQAIFITFSYLTFYLMPRGYKLDFISYAIVFYLLLLTDSRIHIISFFVFGLIYLIGFRRFILLSLSQLFFLPLLVFFLIEYWEIINEYSSRRLNLWLTLFIEGSKDMSISIDSSWFEMGRSSIIYFFFFLPFFIYFLISYTIKLYKKPQNKFICAVFVYFIISNSTDIGAFSATNLFSTIFWSTYFYPKIFESINRPIEES